MIDRIAIFGDSMSDLGRKKDTGSGIMARIMKLMRVNQVGRFSDSKNWADYLWEWSGGTSFIDDQNKKRAENLTEKHFSLEHSRNGSNSEFSFVNYAMGGAIIGESNNFSGKMGLTLIDEQKEEYLKQLAKEKIHPKKTLHIIWGGLNDTVTDEKDPEHMEKLASRIKEFTIDTRKAVESNGGEAYFMIVNNPDPKEAVRYMQKQDDPKLKKAQAANDELNEYLRRNFDNEGGNTKFVDMNELLKNSNLSQLRLIKAAQSQGVKVQYRAPDEVDASLANTLKEFKEMYGQTEEGEKIMERIEKPLKAALRTDNEKPLHKAATDVVMERIRESQESTGSISEEVKFITDALMVNGTYAEQLDFATKYYETAYNGKSQADIDRIRGEINKIVPKDPQGESGKMTSKDFNLLKDTKDDLYASHTGLYDVVSKVLDETKDPEFRKLIENITANNLGFIATSDQAHPTDRAHRIAALEIASGIIEGFNDTPGHDFIRNVQTAFGDAEIFREYQQLDSPDKKIPFSSLVEKLPSAEDILRKGEKQQQQVSGIPGIFHKPTQPVQFGEITQALQQNQTDSNRPVLDSPVLSAAPTAGSVQQPDHTPDAQIAGSDHPDVNPSPQAHAEAQQLAQPTPPVQQGQMPPDQMLAQQAQVNPFVSLEQMAAPQMPQAPSALPVQQDQMLVQQAQVNSFVSPEQMAAPQMPQIPPDQAVPPAPVMDINAFAVPVVQPVATAQLPDSVTSAVASQGQDVTGQIPTATFKSGVSM